MINAIYDIHQSALSGAILPQQCQNFTAAEGKIDMIVGRHLAEHLGDPRKAYQDVFVFFIHHLQCTRHQSSCTGGICSRIPGARRLQMIPLSGLGNSCLVSMILVGVTM